MLVIERMTARSSAHAPMWGNNSLTGRPDWPWFRNSHGLAMMLPFWLNIVGRTGTGIGLP